jgi:hypothetical protein
MNPSESLSQLDISEFAARVALHHGAAGRVCALVANSTMTATLATELAEELTYIVGGTAKAIPVHRTANETISLVLHHDSAWKILFGFPQRDAEFWSLVDQLRNNLQPIAGLVLILSPESFRELQSYAPNLSSWIGGRIWRLSDETSSLSRSEIQDRLSKLRAAYKQTDEEVIAAARNNQLPAEPEYAEWLILLGQGGLIT